MHVLIRPYTTGGSRGQLLRYDPTAGHGSPTQTNQPPAIPGRFSLVSTADARRDALTWTRLTRLIVPRDRAATYEWRPVPRALAPPKALVRLPYQTRAVGLLATVEKDNTVPHSLAD